MSDMKNPLSHSAPPESGWRSPQHCHFQVKASLDRAMIAIAGTFLRIQRLTMFLQVPDYMRGKAKR
jgi:hypothetical protein